MSYLVRPRVTHETALIESNFLLFQYLKKHLLQCISTPNELHTYFVFLTINQRSNFSTTDIEKLQTVY